MNARQKFKAELEAELAREGYTLVRFDPFKRELDVSPIDAPQSVELYAMQRMGQGTSNSFTDTWPPGFEFLGTRER